MAPPTVHVPCPMDQRETGLLWELIEPLGGCRKVGSHPTAEPLLGYASGGQPATGTHTHAAI